MNEVRFRISKCYVESVNARNVSSGHVLTSERMCTERMCRSDTVTEGKKVNYLRYLNER